MRATQRFILVFLLGMALLSASTVEAQPADVRNIRPHTMLLIDTSGSMERKPNCICSTNVCDECLPVCSSPTFEQNRWAIVAQALTGEFVPFECSSEVRIGGIYAGQYDEGFPLPHILLPQELGTYTGTQSGNGILDTYLERIKFGLMTFDSVGTLIDQNPLVTQTVFEMGPFLTESAGTKGLYSYGPNAPFRFPGALTTYMINAGARSDTAPEGGLVSMGDDSSASMNSVNDAIQATILGDIGLLKNPLRPFGATPTAALVADFEFFTQTDDDYVERVSPTGPGDPFFNCRKKSAILITDGFPNGDMRGPPVECQDQPGAQLDGTACPYRLIQDTVASMISAGDLDQFYVIGFALDGNDAEKAAVEALLNFIADVGETDEAFFVADRAELVAALSIILNEQNRGATSRTGPALTGLSPGLTQAEFISGFNPSFDAADPWDGILERRRIECVGAVPVEQTVTDDDRFQVQLNRQSTAPSAVVAWSSEDSVTFNGTFSRNLWTVLPPDDPLDVDEINGHLVGNGKQDIIDSGLDVLPDSAEIRNVEPAEFNTSISPEYLFGAGSTDDAQRTTLVNYIHGVPGSGRENERLGDIYHSTPAIVGPLVDDTEDQSYNDWRLGFAHQESPDPTDATPDWTLNERPRVIYAASNDGIIHAFLADDYDTGTFNSANNTEEFSCADGLDAGTELWGFIPPMFLDDLDDLLSSSNKQWYADGNIVVRDLYDVRGFPEDDGAGDPEAIRSNTNVWRTVLFMSFRNGGNGIIALDVTNPCTPEFMWQFTADDLGDTYGQPTAAQIFLQGSGPGFSARQSRGVIIVPGGQGIEDSAASPCTIGLGPALPIDMVGDDGTTQIVPRSERRCWRGSNSTPAADPIGRVLYFIDLATGSVIRQMGGDGPDGDGIFPAPLNGAVSVFRGDIGTVGSAVYTTDADGILWRIDVSDLDPQEWEAEALHDMYYEFGFDDAEPSYYPPALSVDGVGNVVILTGTGNVDVLDDSDAINRVVSIRETLTFDGVGGVDTVGGELNWEVKLEEGEQMTGAIELFSGQAFFGTFEASASNAADQCGIAGSRIFGVDFLDGTGALVDSNDPENSLEFIDGSTIPDLQNSLVIGVQVGQQPVCTVFNNFSVTDPFGITSSLALPTVTSGREFRLIATLGGGSTPVDGLSIDVLDQEITAPENFTMVSGMAETLE